MLSALLAFAAIYLSTTAISEQWVATAPSVLNALLLVATYSFGGYVKFGAEMGWAFFQPGRGGPRFVRLQAAAWGSLGFSLLAPWLAAGVHIYSNALLVLSSAFGFIAQLLTVTSLFAYQPPSHQPFRWRFVVTQRPDGRAYVFVYLSAQITLASFALLVMWFSHHATSFVMAHVSLLVFCACVATSVSLTHGVGGPWLHHGFEAYMPGRGGWRFIAMQFVGWGSFGFALAIALARLARLVLVNAPPLVDLFADRLVPWSGAWPLGLLGVFSQVVITLSLLVFEADEHAKAKSHYAEQRRLDRAALMCCRLGLPAELKGKICDFL